MSKRSEYWREVTQRIAIATGGWGGEYIEVRDGDDVVLDGAFSVEDLETIARVVKEAREGAPS